MAWFFRIDGPKNGIGPELPGFVRRVTGPKWGDVGTVFAWELVKGTGFIAGRFFRRARCRGYTAGGTSAATREVGAVGAKELLALIPNSPMNLRKKVHAETRRRGEKGTWRGILPTLPGN